jgi:hypothetical protein
MKIVLLLLGVVAVGFGLLFAGQGLGYIPWPRDSFMIGRMVWFYAGGGMVAAGVVLIAVARR